MTKISKDILKAVEILNREDVVAIPTETVYGLAGNIYSEKAIKKIFQLKQRPLFNPLIVHVHSLAQAEEIVTHIPEKARLLAKAFWPGSLTLILPKKDTVPDLVTAKKDTVAVRIPGHPVTLELLKNLNFPLAAPSANPFGSISPTQASHVANYFEDGLSLILDGGNCENGIESTIVGFEDDKPVLYRLGSIALEEITNEVGEIEIKNKKEKSPDAPGMLSRHYAPNTSTFLVDDVASFIKNKTDKKIGLLLFKDEIENPIIFHQEVLSSSGSLKEAASRLYGALHKMDKLNLDMIIAVRFPDTGLGKSINDRLQRATKKE
ncbi:L-threonylcarbamoyladenylate synthase [Flagellimonas maritima]|uniref:Threonylcarbamoyl-AMP synthase n=1 Tax=Flagellimonas maritima TaxID=1383885 RepID=A0A2Z4LS16_9FLAO|nr:L-threonylcarbamoyladenylate synthase [Allomuricauda aurantiaca]AWX44626.1 L-threonylcarbamoyladenylate synthase [Allomuricauda aurantiaca]